MFVRFLFVVFVQVVVVVGPCGGSLVSRFRNRQEYVPRDPDDGAGAGAQDEARGTDAGLSDELDGEVHAYSSMLPYLGDRAPTTYEQDHYVSEEAAFGISADTRALTKQFTSDEGLRIGEVTTKLSHATRWRWRPALNKNLKLANGTRGGGGARRWWWWGSPAPGPSVDNTVRMAACYWCGLNDSLLAPDTICHDAFATHDANKRKMRRFFRAKCYYYDKGGDQQQVSSVRGAAGGGAAHHDERGLTRLMFGRYTGGCFKRFLDVGRRYTARGCRAWLPRAGYSRSLADHRLSKLEAVARGYDDICVASPHASLTPFSRTVSLFVRYHVCVCSTDFCNGGVQPAPALAGLATLPVLLLIKSP